MLDDLGAVIHSSIPLDGHTLSHNTASFRSSCCHSPALNASFSVFQLFSLFLSVCLSTCFSLSRWFFHHLLFTVFLFLLPYFFLSFRHSFNFLPFFISFSVYFTLSLFVPLRFILFPSLSLYNVFSLSLSLSFLIYCSLFVTISGHCSYSCHNSTTVCKCRQFRQTACQVSLSDVFVQVTRQAKLPACLFVFVFTSWWMDQS